MAFSSIRAALETSLRAAVRRGIIERRDGLYHLKCRTIDDYRHEFLKDMLLAAIGDRAWWSREDAIRAAARYLGFKRTGHTIQQAFRSAIRGLLHQRRLEADGDLIRRI